MQAGIVMDETMGFAIAADLLQTVEALHTADLLHCSISPRNLLLCIEPK